MSLPVLIAVASLLSVAHASQDPASPSTDDASRKQAVGQAPALNPDDLPFSINRIQRALARPPAIRITQGRPVFRVEVFGEKPTIEDILGPDYLKGPAPYGGMTHQEFLNMVTPKDVQGYAAFSNKEGIVVAATSIALQWALQKAVHAYQQAKDERAREAARKEVQEALEALRKARREAGLPDR